VRTLYLNGHIYSTSAGDVSAFLVDSRQVAWLGDDSLAVELAADVRVDLDGAFVTPAFVDTHVHSTALGRRLLGHSADPGLPERNVAQKAALEHAASRGVACLHELGGPLKGEEDLTSLIELADEIAGPEVIAYWSGLQEAETAVRLGAIGSGGDLFCGALEVEDVVEHLWLAEEHGRQAAFHTDTEASLRIVLDAVDRLRQGARSVTAGVRVELTTGTPDYTRLSMARVTASLRPLANGNGQLAPSYKTLVSGGIPITLGSYVAAGQLDPWAAIQAAAYPEDPDTAISPRAAFIAHTRGGWRVVGRDGDGSGTVAVGSPATFAVWDAAELGVDSVDDRLSRWSTDPRSAVPGLPDLRPGSALPRCLRTVRDGEIIFDAGVLS